MKKFTFLASFLLSAFLLGTGVAHAVNEPTLQGWDNKSKFAQQVPGAGGSTQTTVLKFVRYGESAQNGAQIVSGDAVVYDSISDDGITIDLTTTSADGTFAGLAVVVIPTSDSTTVTSAFSDVGRRNWGWILVHGRASANVTAGGTNNNAVGDILITSSDAGKVTTLVNTGTPTAADNYKGTRGRGGFFFDAADGSSTVVDVFVRAE